MTINQLATKYTAAVDAVNKAEENLREAKKNLKDLEREIEEMNKKPKPKVYCDNGDVVEIVKYRKHSTQFIEFETEAGKFRFIETNGSEEIVFPIKKTCIILNKSKGHVFERYNPLTREYRCVSHIDHIELLKGEDEYDKTREL